MKQKLTLNIKILVILLFCLSSISWAQTPEKPYFESASTISVGQLKDAIKAINLRRSRHPINDNPLQDKEDYRLMLEMLNGDGTVAIHNDIRRWLKKQEAELSKDVAIVFIAHPIDYKKLFISNAADAIAKHTTYKSAYNAACTALNGQKTFLAALKKEEKLIQDAFIKLKDKTDAASKSLFAKNISTLTQMNATIANILTNIQVLSAELEKKKAEYPDFYDQIIEQTAKTNHVVLAMENDDWSEYLLNKKEILFVIVGGKDDIANSKISIANNPSSFEKSFNELRDLTQQLGVIGPGYALDAMDKCDNLPTKINQEIPIKFMLTRPGKIKSPSTISIAEEKSKLDLKLENHELAYMGLKVGVSAAYLERKQFTLDASNNLTIKPDTSQVKEWKSNLMVMLDFYPFGRDIDRLEPIWKKNRGMGLIDPNRFGVSLGLKLSKDPLETSFLGLSYAISKELSINGGFSFNATPKDVTNLPVGVNATLDYLKNNAKRELTTSYFFGISLSPGIMSKTLGLIK